MTLDEIIKMLKADDYVELTPEENNEIVEYLEYYKEQDSVIKMYKAVYCDKQRKVNELEKELDVYKKAFSDACNILSYSSECFNGMCPMDGTETRMIFGTEEKSCPHCGEPSVWGQFLLKKVREEE